MNCIFGGVGAAMIGGTFCECVRIRVCRKCILGGVGGAVIGGASALGQGGGAAVPAAAKESRRRSPPSLPHLTTLLRPCLESEMATIRVLNMLDVRRGPLTPNM